MKHDQPQYIQDKVQRLSQLTHTEFVFEYLYVKGFGWENTIYCPEDFASVRHVGHDFDGAAIFRAVDKKGNNHYVLKGKIKGVPNVYEGTLASAQFELSQKMLAFCSAFVKALGIPKFVNWLANKLA